MNLSQFLQKHMKSPPKVDKKSKLDMALDLFRKRQKK